MKVLIKLIKDSLVYLTHGRRSYHFWMAFLTFLMLIGMFSYSLQLEQGLSVTGMNDRVSWVYIFQILHF